MTDDNSFIVKTSALCPYCNIWGWVDSKMRNTREDTIAASKIGHRSCGLRILGMRILVRVNVSAQFASNSTDARWFPSFNVNIPSSIAPGEYNDLTGALDSLWSHFLLKIGSQPCRFYSRGEYARFSRMAL